MTYKKVRCRKCHGTGLIDSTKEEVIVTNVFGKEWRETRQAIRDWKKNGYKVECDECQGIGEILERKG